MEDCNKCHDQWPYCEECDGQPVAIENLAVMEMDTRTLYPCKNNTSRLDPAVRNIVFGYADGQFALLDEATVSGLKSSDSPVPLVITTATIEDLKNPTSAIAALIMGS